MINKLVLQSVISKYHLNGLVDSVKWVTDDDGFNVKFMSPNNDMLGKVSYTKPFLQNSEVAIYNTSQLNKLLGITSGDLSIDLNKSGKIYTKLLISDSNCDLSYALADTLLIPRVAEVNEPDTYEMQVTLTAENIEYIIKYKNAVGSDLVIIQPVTDPQKGTVLSLTFGEGADHANKIQYDIPCTVTDTLIDPLPFASEVIKEILVANKDMDEAYMYINSEGIMKLSFSSNDIKTTYFLIGKTDI